MLDLLHIRQFLDGLIVAASKSQYIDWFSLLLVLMPMTIL